MPCGQHATSSHKDFQKPRGRPLINTMYMNITFKELAASSHLESTVASLIFGLSNSSPPSNPPWPVRACSTRDSHHLDLEAPPVGCSSSAGFRIVLSVFFFFLPRKKPSKGKTLYIYRNCSTCIIPFPPNQSTHQKPHQPLGFCEEGSNNPKPIHSVP